MKLSKKRAAEMREYNKDKEDFLEPIHHYCQANLNGCWIRADQVHHMKGCIGKNLLDKRYWLGVCQWCHDFIEKNPRIAKELHLSLNRLT